MKQRSWRRSHPEVPQSGLFRARRQADAHRLDHRHRMVLAPGAEELQFRKLHPTAVALIAQRLDQLLAHRGGRVPPPEVELKALHRSARAEGLVLLRDLVLAGG